MKNDPDVVFRLVQGWMESVSYEVSRVQLCCYPARDFWVPPINAFRCRDGFVVCADLAGVDRSDIEVQVEPTRLWILGRRELPEPEETAGPLLQVIAMEIDHGRFSREVVFPVEIDPHKVSAEQRKGLLWISLPLRASA